MISYATVTWSSRKAKESQWKEALRDDPSNVCVADWVGKTSERGRSNIEVENTHKKNNKSKNDENKIIEGLGNPD